MEQIEGTITRIRTTKHNVKQDTKFIIANIRDPFGEEHTIRGTASRRPEIGDFLKGNFYRETHEVYGEQLTSKGHIDLFLPRDPAAIKKRCRDIAKREKIPFTPPTVARIIDAYAESNPVGFWQEFLKYTPATTDPSELTKHRIREIQQALVAYMSHQKSVASSAEIERFFTELGLTWSSQSIRRMLGYELDDSDPENPNQEPVLLESLKADPLCIIELLDIRTAQVVQYLAALQRLGLIDAPTATIGELLKECMTAESGGACCIPIRADSVDETRVASVRAHPKFSTYLHEYNGCLYRQRIYHDELAVAEFFVKCATITPQTLGWLDDSATDIQLELQKRPPDGGKIPNSKQIHAVATMLTRRLSTLQGSAGTGKTTALRLLARYIKTIRPELCGQILFLAPTGKAVNRIKDSISDIELSASDNIMTIHRFAGLLSACKQDKESRDSAEPCVSSPALIVVDESSMISLSTMAMFVRSIWLYNHYIPHIVFIGDGYQLTPVGAGAPFLDLIASDLIANTTLDVVYRQGPDSALLTAITDLREAVDVSVSEPGLFEISLVKDIEKPMLKWIDAHSPEIGTSTIIVPTGLRGLVGKLTPIVRDHVNPASPSVNLMLGDDEILEGFRKGDKVMQIKNNYNRGVFNGEIGVVCGLVTRENEDPPYLIHVKFDEDDEDDTRGQYYSLSEADKELTPAYVLTTHKSQGSEYDHVLIVMDQAIPNFIHRNHIYTAASRGKKSVKILLKERGIMRLWKFKPTKPLTNLVWQINALKGV